MFFLSLRIEDSAKGKHYRKAEHIEGIYNTNSGQINVGTNIWDNPVISFVAVAYQRLETMWQLASPDDGRRGRGAYSGGRALTIW